MPDHFAEALGQTFRLARTQTRPGQDKPHAGLGPLPNTPTPLGLDRAAEGLLTAVGAVVLDIREHVHAVMPRPEDKDFSILKANQNGEKRSDAPTGRIVLDAAGGANEKAEIRVRMREGFVGHVAALFVRATDPAFDAKNLQVTFTLRGATLSISRIRFHRPQVVELDDEIVISIQNLSGAAVSVEYGVEGWLRREA